MIHWTCGGIRAFFVAGERSVGVGHEQEMDHPESMGAVRGDHTESHTVLKRQRGEDPPRVLNQERSVDVATGPLVKRCGTRSPGAEVARARRHRSWRRADGQTHGRPRPTSGKGLPGGLARMLGETLRRSAMSSRG